MKLTCDRGRYGYQHRLRFGSRYLSTSSCIRLFVMDPHHILRSTTYLHLGNCIQRRHAVRSRYRRLRPEVQRVIKRSSFFRPHRLSHLHVCCGSNFLGRYWGDFLYSIEAFDNGCWSSIILHHQHPVYLP